MFYFDESEIENIVAPVLQQVITEIKQRYDLRNNFYNQLRQNTLDINAFGEVNKLLPDFTQKFNAWNQKWNEVNQAAQQNNKDPIVSFFMEGNQIFSEFEENLPRIGLFNIDEGSDVSDFKRETLSRVSEEVENMRQNIDKKVDEAINNLLNIKSESLLEKDFSSSISATLDTAKKMSYRFFIAFIASIFISLSLFLSTFYIEHITKLGDLNQIAFRVSIIAFLWVGVTFIYSHYRYYKTQEIKYTHLSTLLGGGATHINSLIKDGGEAIKNATYQKLVDQFMDITDLTKMFGKNDHPAKKTIDKLLDITKDSLNKSRFSSKFRFYLYSLEKNR